MTRFSKTTLYYRVLRVYSNFIYRKWFSSIEINGESNIPEGQPVIFAPNHQNAMIDAMALLSSSPQPVVFWVRADLFKNKIVGSILRGLKMMPAYRMRNGIQNLKKNEESISNSDDVLTHGRFLCLMPEGGQDEKRTLRPLVKGIFRSAFSAQEKLGDEEWVKIVPTGIDYGNYDRTGRHLIVNFGKPISIKDYKALHDENAPVALNTIRDELSKRMRPLMLDIQSKDHYQTFYVASYLYNVEMLEKLNLSDNETNRLAARQEIVKALETAESDEDMTSLVNELDLACAAWDENNKDTAFAARVQEYQGVDMDLIIKILYLIITIPLQLYAIVMNGIEFIISKLVARKARGTGFEATLKFAMAGILYPIFYIALTIAFGVLWSPDWITTFVFFLSLPFSFFFFLRYRWKLQYVKERLKNLFRKDDTAKQVKQIVKQIIDKTNL